MIGLIQKLSGNKAIVPAMMYGNNKPVKADWLRGQDYSMQSKTYLTGDAFMESRAWSPRLLHSVSARAWALATSLLRALITTVRSPALNT